MRLALSTFAILLLTASIATAEPGNSLPSWNETESKATIIAFVESVTDRSADTFVPESERVAVFDNDGALWCERPVYFQLLFAIDQVNAMKSEHPEWRTTEPFKSVLAGDFQSVAASGEQGLKKLLAASHTGMTSDTFQNAVREWLQTARHPTLDRRYTELVYQPQLELLDYLRTNGFKTYIVSGGGIDFVRVFAEKVYGIPPEQVVGSSVEATYESRDGVPVIVKQPQGFFLDDKEGKPVGIYQHIGRRPILAVGNSDGDFQMLEYTTTGEGPRLGILIHHDDEDREFAYDRDSHIGRLSRGLDEAADRGWVVVSMADAWRKIFPSKPSAE